MSDSEEKPDKQNGTSHLQPTSEERLSLIAQVEMEKLLRKDKFPLTCSFTGVQIETAEHLRMCAMVGDGKVLWFPMHSAAAPGTDFSVERLNLKTTVCVGQVPTIWRLRPL